MSIYIITAIVVLSLVAILATFYAIKFAMILIKVEDALEESLELLEKHYDDISEILTRPLFFDSPEVRQVHRAINACKDSILNVTGVLVSNVSSNEIGEAEIEKEEKD